MSPQQLHLEEVATRPDITPLPIGHKIYVTVRAYNKAGMKIVKHNCLLLDLIDLSSCHSYPIGVI